jgi:type I restriction enzyme S subunit
MKERWKTEKLGTVCVFLNRGISPKYLEQGGIWVLNQRCVRDHRISYEPARRHDIKAKVVNEERYIQLGDVLVNSTGTGTLGRVAQIREDTPGPTTIDSHITIVRPKPGKFFLDFFGYMLILIEEEIKKAGEGCGGQTELARSALAEQFSVSYPTSLPEQQRIVRILDEAFEGIATAKANAEKILQKAREMFESYLEAVFSQRGEGWEEKKLGEICILRSGTTLPKEVEKPSGEIPYLKVADMNISDNLNGVTCSSRYVNKSDVNASNLLPIGTTIFPKRGGAILTNKKRLTKRVICADLNIMGVTPNSGLMPEYLFHFFLRLDLREINNGSSIPQINNYSIEPLVIAYPSSITEQQTIVAKLESLSEEIRRLESIYQRKLAALEELKKSMLHLAFNGEL